MAGYGAGRVAADPRYARPGYGVDMSDPRGVGAVPGPGAVPPTTGSYPTTGYAGGPYAPDSYTDVGYGDESYYDEDDEYGDYDGDDGDLSRRRGCRVVLLLLAVLLLGAGVAAWFGWSWVQDQIDPPGEPGETVLVEIPEGSSTSDIGHELADAGVITDARVWDWYIRFNDPGSFQAGGYRMQLNSSFDEAIVALEAGALPPDATLVTVPEGLTVAETAARLTDPENGLEGFTPEAVEAALADPASRSALIPEGQASVEGTLFPETYQVEKDESPAAVIQRMVGQLDEVMTDLGAPAKAEALGMSPYQVLIVASLVEEEAKVDADRAQIARVIYNRLGQEMPLQIDATSCFAKHEPGCTLTAEDLESDSPYNTRNRPGLIPTPIASPGRASIEAALNPAAGDWLYYVLDAEANDGTHVFTADYDVFVEAKQRCADAGLGCG
jgi:UPF0755 protein